MKPVHKCPLPAGVSCNYRKKIEQLETDLEQFSYLASHDLREPLMGLAGFASLLQKRYSGAIDAQGQHFLEQIIDGAKRMETKLDDLLAFSRAGRTSTAGAFPLGTAVEEAQRLLVRKISETQADISVVDPLPVVSGDRSMLAQVFQNLFSNSIKYRRKDQKPVISVKAEATEDEYCTIAVQDNGIGFDMRHHDRIFGIFQRLYTVEQYPGTGIGLALVKKIVERQGGKVWAESVPGQGTTFFLKLPLGAT